MAAILVVYMQCKWLCFVDMSGEKNFQLNSETFSRKHPV